MRLRSDAASADVHPLHPNAKPNLRRALHHLPLGAVHAHWRHSETRHAAQPVWAPARTCSDLAGFKLLTGFGRHCPQVTAEQGLPWRDVQASIWSLVRTLRASMGTAFIGCLAPCASLCCGLHQQTLRRDRLSAHRNSCSRRRSGPRFDARRLPLGPSCRCRATLAHPPGFESRRCATSSLRSDTSCTTAPVASR